MGIAKNHRKINNYPIGAHWNQEFIENVCANTLGDVCTEETPVSAVQKAKNLASAIYESAKTGFRTVTPEQMVERQTICQTSGPNGKACQYYVGATGLLSVYCGKCGCSKLKLHLQSSVCPINKWPILSQ
jgi:hypothetical protein